jgi:hypothetical protein
MSTIRLSEYKDALRESVCGVCVSFTAERENPTRCVHEQSGACSLFAHLTDVVDAVSAVDSGSIEPYVTALRNEVCANCSHQDKRGFCELRDGTGPMPSWCVLDAYFNVIVGAIEDVQKQYLAVAR